MLLKRDLSEAKDQIEKNIGNEVLLEFSKGRRKSVAHRGIISSVYPSIFTVQIFEGKDASRKLSFSYVDILTNSVEITLV